MARQLKKERTRSSSFCTATLRHPSRSQRTSRRQQRQRPLPQTMFRKYLLPLALAILTFSLPLESQAQQAPTIQTAKWTENVTHRSDICDRHVQVMEGLIPITDALQGLNLTVVFVNYNSRDDPDNQQLFSLTEDGVINEDSPPLHAVVMDAIALRAGFTWRDSFGIVEPLDGRDINANLTWSALLKWNTAVYDISMGQWDRSAQRLSMEIAFPEGFYDASMILVQLDTRKSLDWGQIWTFLLPFQNDVWWMILVALIASGALYYLLEKLDPSADDGNLEGDPGAAVYFSFITFTGHHEFNPRSHSARLLAFSMTFWGLITAAAYTANLASFLLSRSQPEVAYHTIREAAVVKTPICVQRGVNIDQYITAKYPTANLVRKRTSRLVFDGLNDGECEVAVVSKLDFEKFRRNNEVNSGCDLWWSGRVEAFVPSGIGTSVDTGTFCTSLVDHVLDYHILQMKFEGFFDRVVGEYLKRTGDHSCVDEEALDLIAVQGTLRDEDEDTQSLSLQEMGGIFIVHAILCCVSLLLAIAKFYLVKREMVHSSVRNVITKGSLRSAWLSSSPRSSSRTVFGGDTDTSDDPNQQKPVHRIVSSRSTGAALTPDTERSSKNLQPIFESKEDQQSLVSTSYEGEEEKRSEHVSSFPNTFGDSDSSEGKLSV